MNNEFLSLVCIDYELRALREKQDLKFEDNFVLSWYIDDEHRILQKENQVISVWGKLAPSILRDIRGALQSRVTSQYATFCFSKKDAGQNIVGVALVDTKLHQEKILKIRDNSFDPDAITGIRYFLAPTDLNYKVHPVCICSQFDSEMTRRVIAGIQSINQDFEILCFNNNDIVDAFGNIKRLHADLCKDFRSLFDTIESKTSSKFLFFIPSIN